MTCAVLGTKGRSRSAMSRTSAICLLSISLSHKWHVIALRSMGELLCYLLIIRCIRTIKRSSVIRSLRRKQPASKQILAELQESCQGHLAHYLPARSGDQVFWTWARFSSMIQDRIGLVQMKTADGISRLIAEWLSISDQALCVRNWQQGSANTIFNLLGMKKFHWRWVSHSLALIKRLKESWFS